MDSADELMGYLPPAGWADVATKSDLEMLRLEMEVAAAGLRTEMANLRGDINGWMLATMITMMTFTTAVVFGAAKFVH